MYQKLGQFGKGGVVVAQPIISAYGKVLGGPAARDGGVARVFFIPAWGSAPNPPPALLRGIYIQLAPTSVG